VSREAVFMGRVTASATHELRNVLAIIRESAGLIEDLLSLAEDGKPLKTDKLRTAASRVEQQVQRGTKLMDHLNRIAHAPDHEQTRVDLGEEIRHSVALCDRFARRRQLELVAEAAHGQLAVDLSPLTLHELLLAVVDCGLETLPAGATMRLRAVDHHGRPAVELTADVGDAAPLRSSGTWSHLVELARLIGAELEERPSSWGILVVPRS
jgi:C4-dicarboxylate-specific signal transduction histidine kinase